MRPRRSRRRLEPDARRAELIEAAEQVLRKRGAETRVEDVVRAAGVAKGTFYLYFASWEELLRAIRERVFEAFDALVMPARLPADSTGWWELADALAVGFVDFVLELEGLHEAIFHGTIADDRRAGGVDATSRIVLLLEAGAAAGVFAKLDAEPVARLIFAMLHAAVDAIAAGQDRERVVGALRAVLRPALRRNEADDE